MRRAVFLDRDGVINRALVRKGKPHPPCNVDELEILDGVQGVLERFRRAGFLNVVVTNQPDVARGTTDRATVQSIHERLRTQLAIDAFYTCWHDDADGCTCRKPLPGLLLNAASDQGIALKDSVIVGDRWRDIVAGQRAGCRTVWIKHGYDEPDPPQPIDLVVGSLMEAAEWILGAAEQNLSERQEHEKSK